MTQCDSHQNDCPLDIFHQTRLSLPENIKKLDPDNFICPKALSMIRFGIVVDDDEFLTVDAVQTKTSMQMHIKDIPLLIRELKNLYQEQLLP